VICCLQIGGIVDNYGFLMSSVEGSSGPRSTLRSRNP
jgi:hypothetical protein